MRGFLGVAQYLTIDGFKDLTTLPDGFVDDVEAVYPKWLTAQLSYWSRWIDSRLRKRYQTPFAAHDDDPATPITVQGWLSRIVSARVMIKRGFDPSDKSMDLVSQDYEDALAEIVEAADEEKGLFDLPEIESSDASLIRNEAPRVYSERSPYVSNDIEAEAARDEDENGFGSYG